MKKYLINCCFTIFVLTLAICLGCGSSNADREQHIYQTVKLKNQEWLAKNLNVSKFKNGDEIYHARSELAWIDASKRQKPAYRIYESNPRNAKKYGKLYNWYAIADPRGLAPEGFHIPSQEEFELLINNFSNENCTKFEMLVKGGDNDFNACLGGCTGNLGNFEFLHKDGYYWTASEVDSISAWCLHFGNQFKQVHLSKQYGKNWGFSVRCIKD